MTAPRVLVAGAGGDLGFEISKDLAARGCRVTATYRTKRDGLEARFAKIGVSLEQWDIFDRTQGAALLQDKDAGIFTPILFVSENAAALAPENCRQVFFSSNNVAVDFASPVYETLRASEERILKRAPRAKIIRPTMIYGYPGDGNLSKLMAAMRRWPVMPRIGRAGALQQPVYFQDLAKIAGDIALEEDGAGPVLAVSGPAPVTQADLYRAVRDASGATASIIPLPAWLVRAGTAIFSFWGREAPLSAAQIARANEDKTPAGEAIRLGATPLDEGLRNLAAALDGTGAGA